MKKLNPRHYVYLALSLLIVGSYVVSVVVWHHQRGEIRALQDEMTTLFANQAAIQGPTYNDVTIAPSEQSVYLPQAKLKLAATQLTQGLVYTYTGPYTVTGLSKKFPANLSLSTHDLAANAMSSTQQFDCTEVVYADFVTPSYAVNPHWKLDGSAKLADGRTMNVYYAPSIPGCEQAWKLNNIDSKAIADALKQAASY